MVRDVENFALGQLKQMYDECLYLLCNAYACKRTQKACEDGVLIDWKFEPNKTAWKELQRLECGFKEYDEPIHITRSKYVALFEGKPDARLYDEITDNILDCQSKKQIEEYIKKLASKFDDCAVCIMDFYKWVGGLDWGNYEGGDSEVLCMWDRLNYCIMQFKGNVNDIAKRFGMNTNVKNKFKTYILAENKEKVLSTLHTAIDPLMQSNDRGTKKEAVGYIRAAIAMGLLSSNIAYTTFKMEFGNMGKCYGKYMEQGILCKGAKDNWESVEYKGKLKDFGDRLRSLLGDI